MEIENDIYQKKIDELEKVSERQATEIEQLKSTINDCLTRIASLESTVKSDKSKPVGTPNSLRLTSPKARDVQLRKSLTSPRTPAKATRLSGTPTRRSTSDLAKKSVRRSFLSIINKESHYLKGEGVLRIFLKGRPVNFHVSQSLQDSFDAKNSLPTPDESLKMEWVYGYRGRDCRKNLFYLESGELVYFVAGVVILYNLKTQEQRHYCEHTDDVKCLALHPDKVTFASGQVASHSKVDGKPHVRIWNSTNLQTIHIIGLGHFDRAVCVVAFSKSDGGSLLCTVDEANDHNLTVWSWAKKKSISTAKSSTEAIVDAEFHPQDSNTIVTCGKNHLAIWQLEKNTLVKKTAIYEKFEKPKIVQCVTFTNVGEIVTGDSSGNIIIWSKEKRTILRSINHAHNGPIFSLLWTENNTIVSGGGKDHAVYEWDLSLKEKKGRIYELQSSHGCCRTLCEVDGHLIAGTTNNCILKLAEDVSVVLNAHYEELWGLTSHNSLPLFYTGGFDRQFNVWDADKRALIFNKQFDKNIQSVALNPVSKVCVCGFVDGSWELVNCDNGDRLHQSQDGNEPIQCCEFSPDGSVLALGSRDNAIYIYKFDPATNAVSKVGKCVGHSSFITHLDWSADGQHLRSNSGDYELLFWTAADCKQVTATVSLVDVAWSTCNCSLAFECAGIWPEGSDGTDINAVAKAHSKQLIATADDFGKVNLYRYPAAAVKSNHKSYGGHSSHVTGVKFLFNDQKIVSTGGQDTAIIQWVVA